jgi:hypothetical protein
MSLFSSGAKQPTSKSNFLTLLASPFYYFVCSKLMKNKSMGRKAYPTFPELHKVQVALMVWWILHCGSPFSVIFVYCLILFGTPIVHDPLPALPLIGAPSRSNLINQLRLIYIKKKLSDRWLRNNKHENALPACTRP